jgi:hypothetical protein
MERPAITIAHTVPGRIRLKVPKLRDNETLATQLQERFAATASAQLVGTNTRTGSLVIHYDPVTIASLEAQQALLAPLAALFPADDLPDLAASQAQAANGEGALPPLAATIRSFFDNVNKTVDSVTGGNADLKVLVPSLLFGLGVRSLLQSEKLMSPAWYDFLWFAIGTYFMLNPKPGEDQR